MQLVPLKSIPNQSLSVQLNSNNYDLLIRACNNIMAVDLVINNVIILSAQRVVAGTLVIPYTYLENGNFLFVTENDEYPNYSFFGITQNLIYLFPDELESIRASA